MLEPPKLGIDMLTEGALVSVKGRLGEYQSNIQISVDSLCTIRVI